MSKYEISRQINISGPDGNVFSLIGIGRNWLRDLGASEQRKEFSEAMTAGTYADALATFRAWFGDNTISDEPEAD